MANTPKLPNAIIMDIINMATRQANLEYASRHIPKKHMALTQTCHKEMFIGKACGGFDWRWEIDSWGLDEQDNPKNFIEFMLEGDDHYQVVGPIDEDDLYPTFGWHLDKDAGDFIKILNNW